MSRGPIDTITADLGISRIHAFTTLRANGNSSSPFNSLNFGDHVGDDPQTVKLNREMLRSFLPGEVAPRWLCQIHGVEVIASHARPDDEVPVADAAWTDRPGRPLAVMTADCLPIGLAGVHGDWVAIVHAGWRGLAAGIIDATLAAVPGSCAQARAWFGPAIGACCFEVGEEVREVFVGRFGASAVQSFKSTDTPGKYLADISALAAYRLRELGVGEVSESRSCTVCEPENFFSHRRDGKTGRMATVAMILPS